MGKGESSKLGWIRQGWPEQVGKASGKYAGGHDRVGKEGEEDVAIEVKSEGLELAIFRAFKVRPAKIKIPAEDIESIEFSRADEESARTTLTRMGVGTILLPGIGTMIGFMAKKKKIKAETLALVKVDGQPIALLIKANEFETRTIFRNLAEKIV